jgi:hypothetical protein
MGEKIVPDKFTGKLFLGRFSSEAGNNDFLFGAAAGSKSDEKIESQAVDKSLKQIFILHLVQYHFLFIGAALYSNS